MKSEEQTYLASGCYIIENEHRNLTSHPLINSNIYIPKESTSKYLNRRTQEACRHGAVPRNILRHQAHTPRSQLSPPRPHLPRGSSPLSYARHLPLRPRSQELGSKAASSSTTRAHHFHSVTHECYAVCKGSNRLFCSAGQLPSKPGTLLA